MEITATELKLNLGKYLDLANKEEIVITKNGKTIAQLIGTRTFKYDLSELEQWVAGTSGAHTLGEAAVPAYGTVAAQAEKHGANMPVEDSWLLTCNGEPVAQLTPILKQKKKRRLGFIDGPPVSEETIAALLAPGMTDEEYEEWVNKEL